MRLPTRLSCPQRPAPFRGTSTGAMLRKLPSHVPAPSGKLQPHTAYSLLLPGEVSPHGNLRCSLPPAAAYTYSASLARKPPSQMQKAYASYQLMQFMGNFSLLPTSPVQVAVPFWHCRESFDRSSL